MSKRLFRPPEHLVAQWPEVFEDLHMNTMPLAYIDSFTLEFKDGRIWEIDITPFADQQNLEQARDNILDIFEDYGEDIVNINIKMDITNLKKDIKQSTKKIL